jgi:ATP-dependent Zn protease
LKKIDCDKIESGVESFDLDSPEQSLTVNDVKNSDMKILFSIDQKLTKIVNDIESKNNDQNRIIKWKYISTVLDKIFFYILIIYFFISFIAAVLSLPNFYKFT